MASSRLVSRCNCDGPKAHPMSPTAAQSHPVADVALCARLMSRGRRRVRIRVHSPTRPAKSLPSRPRRSAGPPHEGRHARRPSAPQAATPGPRRAVRRKSDQSPRGRAGRQAFRFPRLSRLPRLAPRGRSGGLANGSAVMPAAGEVGALAIWRTWRVWGPRPAQRDVEKIMGKAPAEPTAVAVNPAGDNSP